MFSSVKKGLSYVVGNRVFLIPGDYPAIYEGVYNKMLGVHEDIVIPVYDGNRSHPLLLNDELIDEKGFTSIDVECAGILMDIDTMEDYENIIKI